jgi:hypothetical protein
MELEIYGQSLLNGERSGLKLLRFNLSITCMFWDGLRKTRRILSQDYRSYVRDMKTVPSE